MRYLETDEEVQVLLNCQELEEYVVLGTYSHTVANT